MEKATVYYSDLRTSPTSNLLDKMEAFEREYEKFREDPLVEEFLDAELAFCRMMQEIDVKLAEAVDFE